MAASGSPTFTTDRGVAADLRVAIVAASWHEEYMAGLIDGARRALGEFGLADPPVVRVPGSFELPLMAQALARTHDAVVALGIVIRGGTPHFEFVSDAVTRGLTRVALDTGTPVGFGVLTCDDELQALARAGLPGSRESKGYEAAASAVQLAVTLRAQQGAPDQASGRGA